MRTRILAALTAVAILVAVSAIIYAFTIDTSDHSSGAFAVQAESTDILVTELNSTTIQPSPWSTSCAQPNLTGPTTTWTCLASIKNLKAGGPVYYSLQKLSHDNADGKNLASNIVVQAAAGLSSNCGNNPNVGNSEALSLYQGFGDAAPGGQQNDQVIPANGTVFLCLTYTYTQPSQVPFGSVTSALYRVSADDQGPFP